MQIMIRLVYEHASASCLRTFHHYIPSIVYHAGFEATFLLFADGMYGAFIAR